MVKVVLWAAVVCLLIGYSQVVQSWKAMPPTRQGLLSKSSLSAAQNYNNELQKTLYRNLFPQPTWRLREKAENVKVVDVLAVLSRFDKREDFYQGKGYSRALGLLNNDDFYEKIKSLPYKRWPLDQNGNPYALDKSLSKQEFEQLQKEVKATVPSKVRNLMLFHAYLLLSFIDMITLLILI